MINMALFKKREETYNFGEFMRKEGKCAPKVEKSQKEQVLEVVEGLATMTLVATAAKIVLPVSLVGVPLVLMASKKVMAATMTSSQVIPIQGEAIMVGAIPGAIKEKIVHSFDPLIDLMVGLSLPIAGVMLTGGALMILVGMKDRGMQLILNSSLGYILVQMSPLFISMLAGIGGAI
jgi:hypothetical protein